MQNHRLTLGQRETIAKRYNEKEKRKNHDPVQMETVQKIRRFRVWGRERTFEARG
jgi:hypothetical protein